MCPWSAGFGQRRFGNDSERLAIDSGGLGPARGREAPCTPGLNLICCLIVRNRLRSGIPFKETANADRAVGNFGGCQLSFGVASMCGVIGRPSSCSSLKYVRIADGGLMKISVGTPAPEKRWIRRL